MKNIFNQFLGTAVFSVSLLFSGSAYSLENLDRSKVTFNAVEGVDAERLNAIINKIGAEDVSKIMSYAEGDKSVSDEELSAVFVNIVNIAVEQGLVSEDAPSDQEVSHLLNSLASKVGENKRLQGIVNNFRGRSAYLEQRERDLQNEIDKWKRSNWEFRNEAKDLSGRLNKLNSEGSYGYVINRPIVLGVIFALVIIFLFVGNKRKLLSGEALSGLGILSAVIFAFAAIHGALRYED